MGEVTATAYAHSHAATIYLMGGASFAQIQGQHIFFRKSDRFRGTAVQANRLLNREHLCLPSADPGDVRNLILNGEHYLNRSQRLSCLRRGSVASRLLGLWVRIPPEACMSLSLSCDCRVLSSRGLYVQKSAVSKCDCEPSTILMCVIPVVRVTN